MKTRKKTTPDTRLSTQAALEKALSALAEVELPTIPWDGKPARKSRPPVARETVWAVATLIVLLGLNVSETFV
jgi:hypothetical protein